MYFTLLKKNIFTRYEDLPEFLKNLFIIENTPELYEIDVMNSNFLDDLWNIIVKKYSNQFDSSTYNLSHTEEEVSILDKRKEEIMKKSYENLNEKSFLEYYQPHFKKDLDMNFYFILCNTERSYISLYKRCKNTFSLENDDIDFRNKYKSVHKVVSYLKDYYEVRLSFKSPLEDPLEIFLNILKKENPKIKPNSLIKLITEKEPEVIVNIFKNNIIPKLKLKDIFPALLQYDPELSYSILERNNVQISIPLFYDLLKKVNFNIFLDFLHATSLKDKTINESYISNYLSQFLLIDHPEVINCIPNKYHKEMFYILLQKRPEIILETLKNINPNFKESTFFKILENKRPESFLTALLKEEPEMCYDFNLSFESMQSSDEQPKLPTFQFGTPVDIAILYSLFHWAEFPSNPKYKKTLNFKKISSFLINCSYDIDKSCENCNASFAHKAMQYYFLEKCFRGALLFQINNYVQQPVNNRDILIRNLNFQYLFESSQIHLPFHTEVFGNSIMKDIVNFEEEKRKEYYTEITSNITPKSKIRSHMLENLCKDIYINNKANLISNDPFMFGIEQAYIPRFFYEDLMAIYYYFVVYLIEKHFQRTPSTKSNTSEKAFNYCQKCFNHMIQTVNRDYYNIDSLKKKWEKLGIQGQDLVAESSTIYHFYRKKYFYPSITLNDEYFSENSPYHSTNCTEIDFSVQPSTFKEYIDQKSTLTANGSTYGAKYLNQLGINLDNNKTHKFILPLLI